MIITISSYIANLVAFLNFETPPAETERIQDSMDLAEQNRVKYGTIQGGTTEAFFRVRSYFSLFDEELSDTRKITSNEKQFVYSYENRCAQNLPFFAKRLQNSPPECLWGYVN